MPSAHHARLRRLLVTACGVTLLALVPAAPAAQAKALRPPKWLKGPYRRYVLTFDATATMQGSETEVSPPPSGPYYTACDGTTSNFQGSETRHVLLSYRFLFGHSRRGFAFVYKRSAMSGNGQASWAQSFSHPSGCPPDPINPDSNESCSAPMKLGGDTPKFDFGSTQRRHLLLETDLYAPAVVPGSYSCSGNGQPIEGPGSYHFSQASASDATLDFTDVGIRAKHTFTGKIHWVQDEQIPNGPGSMTDDIGRQYSWNFNLTENGTFKLAPG